MEQQPLVIVQAAVSHTIPGGVNFHRPGTISWRLVLRPLTLVAAIVITRAHMPTLTDVQTLNKAPTVLTLRVLLTATVTHPLMTAPGPTRTTGVFLEGAIVAAKATGATAQPIHVRDRVRLLNVVAAQMDQNALPKT